MRPAVVHRYRHLQPSSKDQANHQKETSEHSFFSDPSKASFFSPLPSPVIHRKCDGCKEEEKKVSRSAEKEEEKLQRAADDPAKEEEEKLQRVPEEKKEEEIQRMTDEKEEEKVQRNAEKKEEEKLSKKENSAGAGSAAVPASSYVQSIGSKGQSMSGNLQQFYSSRMAYNFSDVRIHTGKDAADSAKNINARAYTYQNHVVFNEGQYKPESHDGRKLIAHELAHVVQQDKNVNKKAIQRVPAGFDIRGVFPDAASFPTTIFFDFNSSTIPSSERPKVPGIATPPARNITLIGTSSEEGGTGSTNVTLINQRINKVNSALSTAGHTGVRTKTPQPTAGVGNIDYRRVRAVDVITTPGVVPPGGALPSTTPACTATPANPTPEVEPCGTSLTNAWPNAFIWTLNAVIKMASADASAIAHASTLFPGIAPAIVTGHLSSLLGQVGGLPTRHQCHNTCDGGCSRPAYNTGSGAGQMMTLCPDYIHSANQNEQSETLIHESLHATPGLTTVDTAYSTTRLITSLTGAQALNNTDSFVLLILRINGIAPPSGAAPADSFSGFSGASAATEQKHAADALAFLEQWLLNAEFDTSLLYTAIDSNIGNAAGWNATENFEAEMAHAISTLVGITDPGATAPFTTPPVANDKIKAAGMFDRYTQLRQKVYLNAMTINKITSGTERWDLSANSVSLKAPFFSLTPENAVKYLLRLMIIALGTVPSAVRNGYIESANEIRKHRGTGP